MESIIENIKLFFAKKDNGEKTSASPKGMCPDCWGHSEWEGKYYEVIKDKHLTKSNIYESFISKIVNQHVLTVHKHENKYICISCKTEIN